MSQDLVDLLDAVILFFQENFLEEAGSQLPRIFKAQIRRIFSRLSGTGKTLILDRWRNEACRTSQLLNRWRLNV